MSAVHQGGVGTPNELATFRVHDAVVDFVERSVWKTRNCAAFNPRYLLENFSGRCWPRSPRGIVLLFQNSGKASKNNSTKIGCHSRPFRQKSLASIFENFKLLAFHFHRSTYLASSTGKRQEKFDFKQCSHLPSDDSHNTHYLQTRQTS